MVTQVGVFSMDLFWFLFRHYDWWGDSSEVKLELVSRAPNFTVLFYCVPAGVTKCGRRPRPYFRGRRGTTYLPPNHHGNTDLLFVRNGCMPLNSNSVYVMPNPNLSISIFTTGYIHTSSTHVYWGDHSSFLPGHVLFFDPKIFAQLGFLNLCKYYRVLTICSLLKPLHILMVPKVRKLSNTF